MRERERLSYRPFNRVAQLVQTNANRGDLITLTHFETFGLLTEEKQDNTYHFRSLLIVGRHFIPQISVSIPGKSA